MSGDFHATFLMKPMISRHTFFPLSVLSLHLIMKRGVLVMEGETLTGDAYKMCSHWKFFHTKQPWSKCTSVGQDGVNNGCLFYSAN